MDPEFQSAKRVTIKKKLNLTQHQLSQYDMAGIYGAIVRMIEVCEQVACKPNEQDLTRELRMALKGVKQLLMLKSKVLDDLKIAKINFSK